MAYITLEELKEILPEIMKDRIDKDDESCEWILEEIEQKCHVGKRKRLKGKKWKKKTESNVYAMAKVLITHRYDINELDDKVNELNKEAEQMHKDLIDIKQITLKDLSNRIEQVRSMAETAKQRTEIDYSKYSGKSDGKISYSNLENKDCKSCKYYSDTEAIKSPCSACEDYQYWEAKDE